MADDSKSHVYSNQCLFHKKKHECRNYDPHVEIEGHTVGSTMKKSCNNYTNDKSKNKICWKGIVLCHGMPKLHYLQTVSDMIKIYS